MSAALEKAERSLDKFDRKVGETAAATEEAGKKSEESGGHFSLMSGHMRAATIAAGTIATALGSVAVMAIKSAIGVQSATASVAAHADISMAAAQKITNAFMGLASKSEFSTKDITNAFAAVSGEFERTGGKALTTKQSVEVMENAMDLAAATGENLSSVTKVLSDTMTAFKLKASDAGHAADVLWNTSRLLGEGVGQVGNDFDRLRPRLAGSGITLQQLGGVMVELKSSLGSGRIAMRLAGRALEQLVTPSSTATKALDQMGISLTNAQGKFIGLGPALNELRAGLNKLPGASNAVAIEQRAMAIANELATDKAQKQTPALKALEAQLTLQANSLKQQASALTKSSALQAIFGRQANTMTALIAGGSQALAKNTQMVAQAGSAHVAAAKQDATFARQMEIAKNSVETMVTAIGVGLLPIITSLITKITPIITRIGTWIIQNKTLVMVIGGVIGVLSGLVASLLVAHAAISKVHEAVDAFKEISKEGGLLDRLFQASPIIAGLMLLVAVVALVITHWKEIKKVFGEVWHWVDEHVVRPMARIGSVIVNGIRRGISDIAHVFEDAFRAVENFFRRWWPVLLPLAMMLFLGPLGLAVGVVVDLIIQHWHTLSRFTERIFRDIASFMGDIWRKIRDVIKPVVSAIATIVDAGWHVILTVTRTLFDAIKTYFEAWWDVVKTLFEVTLDWLKMTFEVAWEAIEGVIETVFEAIKTYFEIWWDVIKGIFEAAWAVLEGIFKTALDLLEGHWSAAWDEIRHTFHQVWDDMKGIVQNVWNDISGFLEGALSKFKSTFTSIWGKIRDGVKSIWSDLESGAQDLWTKMSGFFVDGINGVINILNTFIGAIDKVLKFFHLPSIPKIPTIGGGGQGGGAAGGAQKAGAPAGIRMGHISMAATGGFVTNGPAVLVGEGRPQYPEVVVPTDPMYRSNAMNLLGVLHESLGITGMASGGVWGGIPALKSGGAIGWLTGLAHKATHLAGGLVHKALSLMVDPIVDGAVALASRLGSAMPFPFKDMLTGVVNSIASWLKGKAASQQAKGAGAKAGAISGYIPTGEQMSLIKSALALAGVGATPGNEAAVNLIVMHESGWNASAINLWDINAKEGHPSQGLMQCVTLDTEILTRRGWLRHDEVVVGDQTLGYNPATGRNEWTTITKVVYYDNAPVWRIGNSRWHADVTPNHRWWSDTEHHRTAGYEVCPECGWQPRGQKHPTRGVQVHRRKIHGVCARKAEVVYRGEFVRTENLTKRHRLRLAAPAITDGVIGLSVEEAAIIGWLHGDGHIRATESGSGWDGIIYQSKPENVSKLRALLSRVEHTESVRHRGGNTMPAHVFALRRWYVSDLFKRVPEALTDPEMFVLSLSPEQRAAWLGAMIDAEGHTRDGFTRITQVKGPIQDAIRLAVYLEGWRPTYTANSAERNGFKPCGSVGMARPHVAPSMFHPHKELPHQPVWCVKTGLETWTARLDGQIFLTGNTIPSTFAAYALPGYNTNILDPLSNLIAGIRYAVSRYGSLLNVPGVEAVASGGSYVGYDSGGLLMPGLTMAWNGTGRPELVSPPGGVPSSIDYHPSYVLNLTGTPQQIVETIRQELAQHDDELAQLLRSRSAAL